MTNGEFDFSRYDSELNAEVESVEARMRLLDSVRSLWARFHKPNEALPSGSGKFMIKAKSDKAIPVQHERMALQPKARLGRIMGVETRHANPIAGVDTLRLHVPFLPTDEEGLDHRFVFIEYVNAAGETQRSLLSEDELSPYQTADDVAIVPTPQGIGYKVRQAGPAMRHHTTPDMDEVSVLAEILENYHPIIQNNLPLERE